MLKKQTVFFVQTADVWTTSSSAELCRCGPQTADVLTLKKQTAPKKGCSLLRQLSPPYSKDLLRLSPLLGAARRLLCGADPFPCFLQSGNLFFLLL